MSEVTPTPAGPANPEVAALVATVELNLPVLIAVAEAAAKVLLDSVVKGVTNAEKTANLIALLEPGLNSAILKMGLPEFCLGVFDSVAAGIAAKVVSILEAA
jgi:hypothetical protein